MAFGKKKTKKSVKKNKLKKTSKVEEIIEDEDEILDDDEDEDSIFDDSEDDEDEIEDDDDEEDEDEEEEEIEEKPKKKKKVKANKKKVKTDKKKKISKKVLSTPKGVSKKELQQAEDIILKGFEDKKNENDIKTELALSGFDFSKTILLYKYVTIEHDLVKSPKEIKNEIIEKISESDILSTVSEKIEEGKEEELDYYFFEPTIQFVEENVTFAAKKKIISILKELLGDIDFVLPPKPRKKSINKVEKAIVNYFYSTDEHDIESFTEALEEVTTERVVKRWAKLFKLLTCIVNRETSEGLR